ncbi:SIR2 family protein [Sulfobacillus thermosulfidooxidans]|uniref:SIR2 family protein n=1 Tax=Sulfobacillus thermosulfidooxidans TaxID=28034 RepID=UPI0006B53938|nr:SIR2 family protein [Sulfobacillus thermosulfidooxidans]
MKQLNASEFLREIFFPLRSRNNHNYPHFRQFAWFIGAGCSRSSGIPAASELVTYWEKEFPLASGNSTFDKIAERFPGRLTFQKAIEDVCSQGMPGWGYYVLAQLMTHPVLQGRFNIALTTNFDDLLLTALYWYGYLDDEYRLLPRHVPESTLSRFIQSDDKNPIIIPLHGTAQFEPLSDIASQKERLQGFETHLSRILKGRALIVIGYGGNDLGVSKMFLNLAELDSTVFSESIYWVSSTAPSLPWLDNLELRYRIPVKWVSVDTFENLMAEFVHFFMAPSWCGKEESRDYQKIYQHIEDELNLSEANLSNSAGWPKWNNVQNRLKSDFRQYINRREAEDEARSQDSREGLALNGEVLSASSLEGTLDLAQSFNNDYALWRRQVVNILQDNYNLSLNPLKLAESSTRTVFSTADNQMVVVILCSKNHSKTDEYERYWFGFHGYQQNACKAANEAYVLLVCGAPEPKQILRIPFKALSQYVFDTTEKSNPIQSFWHIRILKKDEHWNLLVKSYKNGQGYDNQDVTEFALM